MTWLARLEVETEVIVRRKLYDCYAWHQAAWECFPGRPDGERDFVTRLDSLPGGQRLYVLGETQPCRPVWCPENGWAVRAVAGAFLEYARYRFDLVANPTRKVRAVTPGGERRKNGRRQALLHEAEQLDWLARKGVQHGFVLETSLPVAIDPVENAVFLRKAQPGTLLAFRFRGLLRVTERERFQEAFRHGIGSAKAFGFGMLLLQPVK